MTRKNGGKLILTVSAISVLATSVLGVSAKGIDKKSYDKQIVVTRDSFIYNKDYKHESFNSLRINEPYILVNGKKLPNGYEYIYKDKIYSSTLGAYELKDLDKIKTRSVVEYTNNGPVEFERMRPNYPMNDEMRYAIDKYKRINKTDNFRENIYNLVKTVLEMDLDYGGSASDQGNLKKGNTMCSGFTWIVSNLLDETDIPYRYVLVMKDRVNPKEPGHVYLEVKDPDNNWRRIECTSLKRIENPEEIEERAKILTNIVMSDKSIENMTSEKYGYIPKDSKMFKSDEIYVSQEVKSGKKLNTVMYQVDNDYYTNLTPIN